MVWLFCGVGSPSNSTATPYLVQEASILITRAGLPLTAAGARSNVSWRPALIAASSLASAGAVPVRRLRDVAVGVNHWRRPSAPARGFGHGRVLVKAWVAVIGGGQNCEHEVSLASATAVAAALEYTGYRVVRLTSALTAPGMTAAFTGQA